MKVCLAYILPQAQRATYEPLAYRFAQSYMANPSGGEPHEIHVVSNGCEISERQKKLFAPLPCQWWEHDNTGRDLGAFQMIAEKIDADLLVCFGSHIHFVRPGWLDRMIQVFLENGPGFYGPWGFDQPAVHLRTTAFWLPSELLRAYPVWIGNGQRYEAEHGKTSLTAFFHNSGFPVIQVTFTKALDYGRWEHVTRADTLFLDQHLDRAGWK